MPRRPRPLGLAPRAAGTARKTGLSSRPASPSRTGQSPDLRATCLAPHQAAVAPPLKATSRATTVGPHPRTLDLTRARPSIHRTRRHALALTKRNANARTKFRAVDAAVARRASAAALFTAPSMRCWRPEAPFAAAMRHGPKTVGCPSSLGQAQRNGARGLPSSNTLRRGAPRTPARPRCFHGAIRTRGVCRFQTDRLRRNAPHAGRATPAAKQGSCRLGHARSPWRQACRALRRRRLKPAPPAPGNVGHPALPFLP